ncbi:hypothetical protein NQ317_000849 [Molorchus minor]|uniref:Proteasome activator complex subunit 3 n=1 Tax=Molorchus minor TaxID=1323400 RepID=A0ABQ9JTI6_9CUCU|nr:hypothetical protein NQ317_000849 [Molorchus minor]
MADSLKVEEYKDELKQKAEVLVLKGFPETIVKLNNVLQTSQLKDRQFSDVHQDLNIPIPEPIIINSHTDLPPSKKTKYDNSISSQDGTKVLILPTGSVPTNKNLVDLIENVKPHIRKLVEDSNLMKMWISFMIPKIEDGNNFGVSIQEDTKTNLKVAKYPHIEDYRRAVQELDEKEYLSLWLVMSEIRNRYCALHDIVLKNLDKIKKPRTTNATESLY